MEDLKAQLNEKQVVERKLSEENRQLYNSMEREVNAIKIGGVDQAIITKIFFYKVISPRQGFVLSGLLVYQGMR